MEDPRILYFGSPEFAAIILERLVGAEINIVGVVTQPDKPVGRKQVVTPPAVKVVAESHGIDVFQPSTLKNPEAQKRIREFKPDLCVVASYGKILPKAVLEIALYGCINVHGSLLPKYRGATPIPAAILAGEDQTGVTIMMMDEGLDTGAMLSQSSFPIMPDETTGSLTKKMADVGGTLLIETLPAFLNGEIEPEEQDETLVTMTRMMKKSAGKIDWSKTPEEIERHIRAMDPWPGAFTNWNGMRLLIKKAHLEGGTLIIDRIQPAGKNEMDFDSFRRGHPSASPDAFAQG